MVAERSRTQAQAGPTAVPHVFDTHHSPLCADAWFGLGAQRQRVSPAESAEGGRPMRNSRKPPILVSERPPNTVDLQEGRVAMLACPHCGRWRAVRDRKLTPHHLPGTGTTQCPDSRRKVFLDITPAQFALAYRVAVRDAELRHEVVFTRPRPHRYPKGRARGSEAPQDRQGDPAVSLPPGRTQVSPIRARTEGR